MTSKGRPRAASGTEPAAAAVAIDGGSRLRKRRQPRPAWTKAKEELFFDRLADSCNVVMAAEHAGVRPQRAYERRARDAAFRGRWDQALSLGYAQLEMTLLQRALHGVEKVVTSRSGNSSIMREYSDRTALALLKMHRETAQSADAEVDAAEYQEACERILERLERIRERDDAAAAAAAVETKSAAQWSGRLAALLGWCRERGLQPRAA